MFQPFNSLAIVIPAYKATYLRDTLQSIANQTNKNFTVYIGDDCSPTNLGGSDLVGQWERCVALSKDEPYIWLFSDDDMMDSRCVEVFYKAKDKYPQEDVFRFNVNIIDGNGNILRNSIYPSHISSKDLFIGKINGSLECFIVEYIFKREVYEITGGFVNFDLAWGSDLASWVKFGMKSGIKTLDETFISWRSSGINISTDYNPAILARKTAALIECMKWGEEQFPDSTVKSVDQKGLVSRLSQMAVQSNLGLAYKGINQYASTLPEKIKLSSMFIPYYLIKRLRNVF